MVSFLEGLTVIDLTRILAGPYASMLLGDLGAHVIKVEHPRLGDPLRRSVEPLVPREEDSVYFASVNRGKQSVAIDLATPQGRTILLELVKEADVVLDNFRPGVLEGLGLSHGLLSEVNPGIISCSISGYGQDGPYRDRAAVDLCIQAMSGVMHLTGKGDEAEPLRMGLSMADLGGALFGVIGILAALQERSRTGRGKHIDVSLLDCLVSLLTYMAANYMATGEEPAPVGSGHHSVVPYQAFRARDGWLVAACMNEKFWPRLCAALGEEALADDDRFATNLARSRNREALLPLLEARFATQTRDEWLDALWRHDVPAAPVNKVSEVLNDPQVLGRNMVRTMFGPGGGSVRVVGNPIKVVGQVESPEVPRYPLLGEHTQAWLNHLGYSEGDLLRLSKAGTVSMDGAANDRKTG